MEFIALASSSTGNAYIVTDGRASLLLECGLRYSEIEQALGFRVSDLDGVLVSHEHADHSKAAADVMRAGVDLYASRGTIAALGLSGHRARPIRALEQFTVGPWTVLPFDTVHDAQEPLGFLIGHRNGGKLLFATDTARVRYRFAGLTIMAIECNYSLPILRRNVEDGLVAAAQARRIVANHMSLERVLGVLRANDTGRLRAIHLLHLSGRNSDAVAFKRAVQRATGKPTFVAGRARALNEPSQRFDREKGCLS